MRWGGGRPANPYRIRYLTPRPELVTERERAVGTLHASGVGTREIAARLGITAHQVGNDRRSLYVKLRLHSVVDLTHYAIRHGWIKVKRR